MDKFEKHIRDNREAFDMERADRGKLWANIESQLHQPKVIPLWKSTKLRVAASIIILFGLATVLGITFLNANRFTQQDVVVSQELQDINTYYNGLVAQQVQLVKNHPGLSEKDKDQFLSFMDELDDEYAILKLEMKKNIDNERVLEAIIGNYKKRIELIEKLLKQINDSKKTIEEYGYTL